MRNILGSLIPAEPLAPVKDKCGNLRPQFPLKAGDVQQQTMEKPM
jgi:hypothetical protein